MEIKCTTLEEYSKRFWKKVDIKDKEDCWEWQNATQSNGYGSVGISKGKTELAHRVAYHLTYGEIPDGLCILHTCDNRTCVNPHHLWLGTINDNNQDAINKGRNAKGERNGNAKLSIAEVLEMRAIYAEGNHSFSELARTYNITPRHTSLIVREDYWKLPLTE